MSMNEKDVVAGKINLDTTKILPAFKAIDEGVRKNAESFKILNAELTITEKNYVSMAKAMDKMALTSDERRKKILDESNALVAQRKASADLLTAKKNQLDLTNQVVDSKLGAQLALQKKRENSIEQQEKEHQQRMSNLQQRSSSSSGSIIDSTASDSSGMLDFVRKAAVHTMVFHTVYSAINEAQRALKEGLVDLESNMAGYVQTNENYFVSYNKGTGEMVKNTQRISEETSKFLQTTHDLGADILDVTESARLWGRMYKDVNIVQEMVHQSTMLSTIDLVGLEAATKGMESTLAQYAVQIKNTNDAQVQSGRIVDSWSQVAHDTMAPVSELTAAFERTGKIADETGVSFDFMNGLMASGIRNTALGGANLGNMWKTVLGTIRTDKAVNELESLGVKTKEVVNGVEQWKKAEDILLDLSIKVTDKNYDLTESYANISRGVFQFAKLAASLNTGDILLGESASINSAGSTLKYLEVQMDTIQRKAAQTKASLLAIFNQAGDDGLRSSIKGALDVIDQLLIGLTKVPKGVFETGAGIAGLIVLYKTVAPTLMLWKNAQQALTAAMAINTVVATEETVAMVALTAASRNAAITTAAVTGGLTLLTAGIALWLFQAGKAEKQQNDLNAKREKEISVMEQQYGQYNRQAEFLPKLVNAHNEFQKQLDSGSLSVEKQSEVKTQLDKVSKALKDTIGEEGLAQLTAAGYTDDATRIIIESLNKRRVALNENISANLDLQATENTNALDAARKKLDKTTKNPHEAASFFDLLNPFGNSDTAGQAAHKQQKEVDSATKLIAELEQKARDIEQKRIDVTTTMAETVMAGQKGKADAEKQGYEVRKQSFSDAMTDFKHLVNMQSEGYKTAEQQASKLKALKGRFKDLNKEDLYGIDEDIYRAMNDKAITAKGFGGSGTGYSIKLSDIDNQTKQAKDLVDSAESVISFYEAKRGALGNAVDDTSTKVGLYTNKQNKLHESNIMLNGSLAALKERQGSLDVMRVTGKITLDEYNQATEQVTTRTASLTKEIASNSSAWWNQAKAIKDAKDQQLKDTFDFSSKWIAHEKATREMSAKEEYDAWVRIQARYLKGTELRKQADEHVYSAKKALIQEEESLLEKSLSKEKDLLNESRQAELDAIDEAKQKFVNAQDEKIRAIDILIKAQDVANSDLDYEKSLAEKQARMGVLASAVGPEGIKERKTLAKEIEKMQLDHTRELTKRDLEVQKQALEDEKTEKEKKFEQDKKDTEDHYK
ncbi:MAG: hypothetical protein WD469_10210, partial [Paenibacillaceae bacterium]